MARKSPKKSAAAEPSQVGIQAITTTCSSLKASEAIYEQLQEGMVVILSYPKSERVRPRKP